MAKKNFYSLKAVLIVFVIGFIFTILLPLQGALAGAIIVNTKTGDILFAENADRPHFPASLTKMMTLYMTFDALVKRQLILSKELQVSTRAASQVPSKLGLYAGGTISVENAILALVTKSANDAAVVLAEELGGTETNFAVGMTMKARDLGLNHTTFRNASGLHDRYQRTTPRDMANLAIALIRDFPQYYGFFSITSFTYQGTTYTNHNNLLARYPGTDGLKTGYVHASGYNLAASVVRDKTRLVGVVLGGDTAADRDSAMANLFDSAFIRLHILPAIPAPTPPMDVAAPAMPGTMPEKLRDAFTKVSPTINPSHSNWSVQVGTYRAYDGAKKRLQEATLILPLGYLHAQLEIEPEPANQLYRAKLAGLTQTEAKDACGILEPAGIRCIAVPNREAVLETSSRLHGNRASAIAGILRVLRPLYPAK